MLVVSSRFSASWWWICGQLKSFWRNLGTTISPLQDLRPRRDRSEGFTLAKDFGFPTDDTLAAIAVATWLNGDTDKAVKDYAALIEKSSAWSLPDTITSKLWNGAETSLVEQVRAATFARHPELQSQQSLSK